MLLWCEGCKREMKVVKIGVGLDFGHGHVYAGDRLRCPVCRVSVLKCVTPPYNDKDHTSRDEYVDATK